MLACSHTYTPCRKVRACSHKTRLATKRDGRPTQELAGNDPRTAGHRYFFLEGVLAPLESCVLVFASLFLFDCVPARALASAVSLASWFTYSPFGANVIQNGDELQALADSPLDGESKPRSAEQADEQKDHAYILVFRNKSSSTIVIGIGGSWTRAVMFTGITTRRRHEQTTNCPHTPGSIR